MTAYPSKPEGEQRKCAIAEKPHIRVLCVAGWWLWACGEFPYTGVGMTPMKAYREWHRSVTSWRAA